MKRVLHVIDSARLCRLCCVWRLIADHVRLVGPHQDALVLGGGADVRLVRRSGLHPLGHLCAPRLWSDSGWRSLQRWLQRCADAGRGYDGLHAWGPWSVAVVGAVPGTPLRMLSVCFAPIEGWRRTLRALPEDRRPALVLAAGAALARSCSGLEESEESDGVRVVPPVLDPDPPARRARADVRQRWGVDEATWVVGLLGEPAEWSDGLFAARVLQRLEMSGRRTALVLAESSARGTAARSWARRSGSPRHVITDEWLTRPWTIAAGLDAALCVATPAPARAAPLTTMRPRDGREAVASALPALWAMQGGVPVVAENTAAMRGVVTGGRSDGERGLLFGPGSVNDACHQLARLQDDAPLASDLVANARAFVHREHSAAAYRARLAEVYG